MAMLTSSQSSVKVFIDTEFTDFLNCDLISIAAVTNDGGFFYGENYDFNRNFSSEWVRANIYPILQGGFATMRRRELSARLWQWFDDLPYDSIIVSFDYDTDYDLLIDLFENELHPKIVEKENIKRTFSRIAEYNSQLSPTPADTFSKVVSDLNTKFANHFEDFITKPGKTRHVALHDAQANCYAYYKTLEGNY